MTGIFLKEFEVEHRDEPVCPHCFCEVMVKRGIVWFCPHCKETCGRQWKNDPEGHYYYPRYREGRYMLQRNLHKPTSYYST